MAATEERPRTYWSVPAPYGYASAIDGFGTVAAPLLAGFGTVVIGITVPLKADSPVRYPGTATAFVALSVLLLLGSVQCSIWARQYAVTPAQMLEWWPDADARKDDIRITQWRYASLAAKWLLRARRTYEAGITALLIGVLVILVPKEWTPSRIGAVALVGIGVVLEVLWSITPTHRAWPLVKRVFPVPNELESVPPPYQESNPD
jgi:hypothetical protein